MTQPVDSPMQTWPIERGTAPNPGGGSMQVARIDTPYGWFMVAPSERMTDTDVRMAAGIFISGHDDTLQAHKPGGAAHKPADRPIKETGL